MKRIASSMSVMLIASFTVVLLTVPNAVASVFTDGLISYHPLDTDGSDATSNNYDGTDQGSPTYPTSDLAPQIGNVGALSVDPSDGADYVEIADNSDLDLGSAAGGTWLAWVKFGSTGVAMNPLSKSMQYWIHATADDEIQAKVKVGGTIYIATTPTGTVDASWHQVAGTYDGTDLKLYLDGVLIDTVPASGTIDDSSNALDLGAWSASPSTDAFDGLLDEVRIYGRALDATEIAFLYDYTGASLDLGPDAVNAVTDTHSPSAQLTPALSFVPVRFEVPPGAGSAANPQPVEVVMTDENGIATGTAYTGTSAGYDDIGACLETSLLGGGVCTPSTDAAVDFAVKYWISELTLSQDFDVNLAGATHTVYGMLDVAVSGVHIQFSVSGQNSASSDETTDGTGQATFTYVSDGNPGDDVITAYVDFDDNSTMDGSDFAATADLDKYWVSELTLSPISDVNPITATHTVNGTLDNDLDDVPILFEVLAGPNVGDSGSVTTTGGVASFTYGPSAGTGTDTIDAFADLNGNAAYDLGIDLPATASASKSWYSLQVTIGGTGGQSVPKGKGRTEWSLSGLANDQAPAGYGEINVNYKAIKDTCSFKPDGNSSVIKVTSTQIKLEDWSATCKVATSGNADLWFDSSVGTKGGFKIDFNNDGAFTNGRDVPIATGTGFFVPLSTGSMTLVILI